MNDRLNKSRMNRRTLGKISAATLLAPIYAQMEAAAQDATPAASPIASPAGGEMMEMALATITVAPGSEAEGADPEGALTLNLGNEINNADPQVFAFLNEIEIGSKVYSPLLALNENNEVADAGADQVMVSEDGRIYQFHIREGMTYSDGTPCTANDYAYAIKRALDPEVNGNYSNILYAITNSEAWRSADPEVDDIDSLKAAVDESVFAVDDQTLEIHLDYAAGYFPYVMTTWVTYPVREDLVEGNGAEWWKDTANYVGNGPYMVSEWQEGQRWVFERNESYYRGTPGIKTITFREVDSSETSLLAFQQGELDLVGPSASQLPQIQSDEKLSAQLHNVPSAHTSWMSFNSQEEPFSIKEVRQAFSFAMNREQYIEQILNGVGNPAGSFLYDGIPGYQEDYQQTYDPEKAAQLMEEAGFPGGEGFPPQTLYYNSESAIAQQQATYWAQGFQQALGVVVEPTPLDAAQMQNMRTNRDPDLIFYIGDWYEDYPHPQNWLSLVWGPGSTRAPLGWENQEFYDLVTEADQLAIEDAIPLYQQADALLAEEAPAAFYLHGEGLVLLNPRVQGYVTYPTDLMDTRYQIEKIYVTAE